jgi:hypothetical protein
MGQYANDAGSMSRIRYSESRLVSCAIFLASPWPALLAEVEGQCEKWIGPRCYSPPTMTMFLFSGMLLKRD